MKRIAWLCALAMLLVPSLAVSAAIGSGETIADALGQAGEQDDHTFTATAGETVVLLMALTSGWYYPEMLVRAPSTALVSSGYGRPSARLRLENLPETGTYHVTCRDADLAATGGYVLSLIKVPGSPNSSQDPDGGSLEEGQPLNGTISVGDLDAAAFWGDKDDSVSLQMTAIDGSLYPCIELIGPDGRRVNAAASSPSAVLEVPRLPLSGTYYAIYNDGYDGTGTGGYTATLTAVHVHPRVVASMPVPNEPQVAPCRAPSIQFSKPMWKAKVENNTTFRKIVPAALPASRSYVDVPFTFDWSGTVGVRLVPDARLEFGARYEVIVGHGAQSADGYTMFRGEDFLLPFTVSQSFIATTNPASGVTDYTRWGGPVITFRWRVVQDSAQSRFSLRDIVGNPVAGAFEWLAPQQKLRFRPAAPLDGATTYVARIGPGLRARDGRSFTWPEEFTFTTNQAPVALSWLPRGSAVAMGTMIKVVFDIPMHAQSIRNNFTVLPSVTGDSHLENGGKTFVFDPQGPLPPNTDYQVTVGAGARSQDGFTLGRTFTWTFHTAATAGAPVLAAAVAPATSGAVQIALQLGDAATVQVRICNMAGRDVAQVPARAMAQGATSMLWDGKSNRGNRLPAGAYLAHIEARAADGATARQVVPFQLP